MLIEASAEKQLLKIDRVVSEVNKPQKLRLKGKLILSLSSHSLDALSENGIGDEGAKSLSEVFPTLTSLETLK